MLRRVKVLSLCPFALLSWLLAQCLRNRRQLDLPLAFPLWFAFGLCCSLFRQQEGRLCRKLVHFLPEFWKREMRMISERYVRFINKQSSLLEYMRSIFIVTFFLEQSPYILVVIAAVNPIRFAIFFLLFHE